MRSKRVLFALTALLATGTFAQPAAPLWTPESIAHLRSWVSAEVSSLRRSGRCVRGERGRECESHAERDPRDRNPGRGHQGRESHPQPQLLPITLTFAVVQCSWCSPRPSGAGPRHDWISPAAAPGPPLAAWLAAAPDPCPLFCSGEPPGGGGVVEARVSERVCARSKMRRC